MAKSKKVLVVINLFGSAANFVGGQFKYLGDKGYEMHLICSPDPGIDDFVAEQGIFAMPIPLNRTLSIGQDFKSLIAICRYIRRNKIDTVIGHQTKGRLLSMIACFLTRVPNRIIFSHGAIFETSKGIKRRLLILENKLESVLADKVVCVSTYIKDLRKSLHIDMPEKQVMLGSGTCGGIDTKDSFNPALIAPKEIEALKSKYGIRKRDFVIGFVGRLVRDKGVDELLSAFEILRNRHSGLPLKLLVVGEPERRDAISSESLAILQNSPDIVFTGRVPHKYMPHQYCCMDCLILPSHREGFGFCNIEAQAMHVPVLTTSITGCRDSIINDTTGLYIDLDPTDIADKTEMLFDEKKRRAMGRAGRDWVVSNFDHTVIWPHVKELLDSFE